MRAWPGYRGGGWRWLRLWALPALMLLAGCGGAATTSGHPPHHGHAAPASHDILRLARVGSLGQVLVNAQGHTLYVLSTEHGGRLTCTAASGCLQYWPELDLSANQDPGTVAVGSGISRSLLGSVIGAEKGHLLTYGGWPLYTYSGDSGPGQTNGQGLHGYGGTWRAVSARGTPVTTSTVSPTPSNSGTGGY